MAHPARHPISLYLFPVTLSAAWVLAIFAITPAPLWDLWRPLLIVVCLAALWTGVATLATRGAAWMLLGAGATWVLVASAWFVAAVLGLLVVARLGLNEVRRRRGRAASGDASTVHWVARMANTLGATLCVVGTVGAVSSGALSLPTSPATPLSEPSAGPSIYLIMLDGYPRADTIAADLEFSNDAFLSELAGRGFEVASESRSNYDTTLATLASIFHRDYLHSIPSLAGDAGSPVQQVRRLTSAISRAPVPEELRAAGYEFVNIRSWYGEATVQSADRVIDTRTITQFEEQVLRLSTLGRLLLTADGELVAEQLRAGFRSAVGQLASIAREGRDHPVVVLAHLFSPHTPILFEADGSPRELAACYPADCPLTVTNASGLGMTVREFGQAMSGQIAYVNRRVLGAVDEIVAGDPQAVIVLFSDHGARYDDAVTAESFHTLFAARTPGRTEVFPDDPAPVNIFPALYRAYLGANVALHPYEAWSADTGAPLVLTRVDDLVSRTRTR